MKKHLLSACALLTAVGITPAAAQTPATPGALSGESVKIGVLTDMSGVYSDITGKGSLIAAQMAMDDCLKAECAGMKIELI
ncbi:MAG: hypothetical protein B7Z15_13170, partial [Rhizobiales bacterium 32-66-8]